jgi:hypothetical protein
MTAKQLIERRASGEIIIEAIYHSGSAKEQTVRDAKTGGRRLSVVVRETFVTKVDILSMSQWMPDGTIASTWKANVDNGKPCVIIVEAMELNNGMKNITKGSVEALTA